VSGSPQNFTLAKPVSPETLQALRAQVRAAIEAGVPAIGIDIDDVGVLDSPLISALISMLREARERGGSVTLCASRKSILDTLHITALDKVFTIVSTVAPAAPPPAPRRKSAKPAGTGRAVAAFAGALFAIASFLSSSASAQTEPSPDDIIRSVAAQNAQMQSYQARFSLDLALRTFPYLAQHLDGTTYFKRPDSYEIVFDKVPSYARGFDKIYTDVGNPTSWPKHFNIALVGEDTRNGHRELVLRLVQKVRGMIDHEDVDIDPAAWHVDSMEWHYYNGGDIAMTQEFENVGGFSVLSKQHATIRIPFVHAGAEAVYRNYQTNVAINDGVFTGKAH
jgi:anti-sigma B factor antagonist